MEEKEIKQIINETVNLTIIKLKMTGMLKGSNKTAAEKTEELLSNYTQLKKSAHPYTKTLIQKIDAALLEVQAADEYYDMIPMLFFEGATREAVAEHYDVTVTTVSRHKKELIDSLKILLFSDDTIIELFL